MKSRKRETLDDKFQFWLRQIFMNEGYYSLEQMDEFFKDTTTRERLFDEFIQTEFLLPYTDEYIEDQLNKFRNSVMGRS